MSKIFEDYRVELGNDGKGSVKGIRQLFEYLAYCKLYLYHLLLFKLLMLPHTP